MSDAVAHLSPTQALRMVAAAPEGKAKTAATLWDESAIFANHAERLDRLAVSSLTSNRRKARQLAKARNAETQRANSKVAALAAREVERRKAKRVGDALRNPVSRLLLRLGGRRG